MLWNVWKSWKEISPIFMGQKVATFWRSPRSFSIVTGVQSTKKLFFAGSKQLLGTIKRCCTVLFFFRIFMGKATFIVYWHAIEALCLSLASSAIDILDTCDPHHFLPKSAPNRPISFLVTYYFWKKKNLILLPSLPLSLLNFMKRKKNLTVIFKTLTFELLKGHFHIILCLLFFKA